MDIACYLSLLADLNEGETAITQGFFLHLKIIILF